VCGVEAYLLEYVKTFQRKSITSTEFKEFFIEYWNKAGKPNLLEGLDWDHFFFGEGPIDSYIPVKEMTLDRSLATNALSLAKAWLANDEVAIEAVDPSGWSSKEWEVARCMGRVLGMPVLLPEHDV